MKKFRIYLTGILIILCQIINAQGKTVEDYGLAKKVNVSNNFNVGKLSLSVPLYDIDLSNQSLNGYLDYQQETPKNEEPGITGTNWGANIGGKIVIAYSNPGIMHSPQTIQWSPDGFHSYGFDNCLIPQTNSSVSKKQILNNPNTYLSSFDPNIFYFDFLGHKGYFICDNIGNFLVYSEDETFTVTYNGVKCHDIYQPINSFPEIVMKDSKGNEYYFGGDYNSMDVYYSKNKYEFHGFTDDGTFTHFTDLITNKHINYLSTFYLKKVKSANSRTIEYFYKNANRSVLDPFTNGGLNINADYSYNMPPKSTLLANNIFLGINDAGAFSFISESSSNNSSSMGISKTNIYAKLAIIDSVKISDYGTLSFSYDQLNNAYTKPFLKKIQLKSYNKVVKAIDFNYNIVSGRVFLESLVSNNEKYRFEYYDYPSSSLDTNAGLLKKIFYPTQGWEEFIYEQNDVSKLNQISNNASTETNTLVNVNTTLTTGQRLKAIFTYESVYATTPLYKKYSYTNDDGTSSGITSVRAASPIGGSADPSYSSVTTSMSYRSSYDENVRYSKVTEEVVGKERNDYYFTDLLTNPDSIAIKKYTNNLNLNLNNILNDRVALKVSKANERGKLYKMVRFTPNMLAVSTKTIKYSNFLNNANPINEISNTCANCKISDDRYYIEAKKAYFSPNINGQQSYYVGFYQYQPVLPYLPISIKTTEQIESQTINGNYIAGQIFDSQKFFKYNTAYLYWHPYAIETTDYLPYEWPLPGNPPVYNGKIITRTIYPQDLIRNNSSCITGNCPTDNDLVGGKFSIYKYMADNSIIAPIIEEKLNKDNKISLTENVYSKDATTGNLLKMGKHRQSLLNSTFTLDTPSSATVEEKDIYQLYDNLGNLLQSKNNNGIPTTVIYGYRQTLPIAEITGATYAQVMQAYNLDPNSNTSYLQLDIVNKSNVDVSESAESNLISALDNFRLKPELKDFHISTYVYDPLIGVKTVTALNGTKEVYKYDGLNRPKKILDINGDPVKVYDYNFAPRKYYNAYFVKAFTRNNCQPGYVGSPYLYGVLENTYFSTISQADADQMAENDANANGQNEANLNGQCYAIVSCPFTGNNITVLSNSTVYNITNNDQVFFKVSVRGYPINTSYWNNEIYIGQISGSCAPHVERTFNNYVEPPGGSFGDTPANRTWSLRVDVTGKVYVKLLSGSVGNNSANPLKFDFLYFK